MIHFSYPAHRFYRQFAKHLMKVWGRKSLPRHIVVACSGGPDSMVLLDLMHRLAMEQAVIPVIVHVNHKLRGKESSRDARFVHDACHERGLPVMVVDAPVPKSGNVQSMARQLRYAVLAAVADHINSPLVLTAHHADDQAETVLLHLMRGSGPDGLSGIFTRRILAKKIILLRPMLIYTRKGLLRYLKDAKLCYVRDSSNQKLTYTRNWVRKKVIPLLKTHNPRIVEALCQVAEKCR